MKKLFVVFAVMLIIFSCSSKRPEGEGEYSYSLTVNSIQSDAGVELLDGKTVVMAGTTDEKGVAVFDDVRAVAALTVKVCGGTVDLVSSEEPVAWTGCTYSSFKPEDRGEITVTVDFLSTFILKYETETTVEEWKEYLDMTTLPAPSLQSSLTDATKRYLWQQGIAKIAENVSKANSVTPESMYSTENLLNLLVADLVDDKIINGSTEAKFGSLEIGSIVLKSVLADAIPSVSKSFSATDLKSWTDKLRYSDAKFLEGSGGGIDSDKPVITIHEPLPGSIVFGEVEVLAEATDNIKVTSLNCRITGEDMPELSDKDSEPDSFQAVFDSTEIPDGEITINCIASDGTSLTEKSVKVTVSNSNKVKLSAFITTELYEWDNVSVYDSENKRVVNTAFDEDEETEIFLAPGTYRFTFKGGYYKPVFLDEEEIKFDSTLETRSEVKAGEVTEIVATPLTTLREHLYRALAEKGDAQAEKKSFDLISEHIDKDFPLYAKPQFSTQLTERSKYYIVLASLERLAILAGERNEPPLEKGSITIEQVLKSLSDDLENADIAVLDGFGKLNQFEVDSYFFRYWYAIALKLFLESDENLTGLGYSDLQTVIHNISMNDSELFPADKKPLKVTDKPPVISDRAFKRGFDTDFQAYSLENIIYANSSLFDVRFKVLPDESGDLFLDYIEVFGDIEVEHLSDFNDEGIFTAKVRFESGEDGEKTIGITGIDNADNTGTATLMAVKDTVAPVISNLGNDLPQNVTTPLTVPYTVIEDNPLDSQYAVTVSGGTPLDWTSLAPALNTGDITVTNSKLEEDGAYTLHFKAVDKAGNTTARTKTLIFDREVPTAEFTTIPEINEHGFVSENSIAITVIATDNVTPEDELIHQFFDGVSWVDNPGEIKNVWNMPLLSEKLYERKYRVKDLAGNNSADINVKFTVDTIDPVLTTNKTTLESRAYRSDDEDLKLISTCTDTNLHSYTYSISGGEPVDIDDASTPLTNSESLVEGLNVITVRCSDKADNEVEETINLVINNTAPDVLILSSPNPVVPTCGFSQSLGVKGVTAFGKAVKARYWYKVNDHPESSVYEVSLDGSGVATVSFPHSGDPFYNNAGLYKNLMNTVTFFFTTLDDAGNESELVHTSWLLDRKPPNLSFFDVNEHWFAVLNSSAPSFHYDDFDYDDIWGFIDQKAVESGLNEISKIYAYRNGSLAHTFTVLGEGGTLRVGECINFYCGGAENIFHSCRVCAYPERFPEIFELRAVFEDLCGNSGSSNDCKNSSWPCIVNNHNSATPPLYVGANFIGENSLKIDIQADGADITSCVIRRGSTFIANCQNIEGSQIVNTASYSEGNYTVTATSRFSGGTQTTTRSASFVVDRTPFSISVTQFMGKTLYLHENPSLSYSVAIASGVKNIKLYLHDRTVNKRYAPAGYTCDSEDLCSISSYNKRILNSSNASGVFSIPRDPSGTLGVPGGIYTQIRYEVEPNFGSTRTGTITITPVRMIAGASEDVSIWNGSGEEFRFRQSIISKKMQNSRITVAGTNHYPKICFKNGNFFYKWRAYKTSPNTNVNASAHSSYGTVALRKPKSIYHWFRTNKDSGAYSDDGSCNSVSDCPPNVTQKCSDEILGPGKECVASQAVSSHYSDSGSFSHPGGHSCNCNNWSGHSQCLEYNCQYLRDMDYYPSSAYIRVADNSVRPATVKYLHTMVSARSNNECF